MVPVWLGAWPCLSVCGREPSPLHLHADFNHQVRSCRQPASSVSTTRFTLTREPILRLFLQSRFQPVERYLIASAKCQSTGVFAVTESRITKISDGRTDLVFDHLAAGHPANAEDSGGVSLIKWCAYFGDVSAIRFLVINGESLRSLGDNYDLNGAAFHGHPRLCQYLIEHGADVNKPQADTGETPLHATLCKTDRAAHDVVLKILLANGANPNCSTKPSVPTDAFMRDIRTRAETPLHRAAAYGTEETIQMLLDAGARVDVRDMNGDSPLTWASWHLRPRTILRMLCFGSFRA
jgi:hypothetical protein